MINNFPNPGCRISMLLFISNLISLFVNRQPSCFCSAYLLDRCSTSGGEPEDACMKLVYHVLSRDVFFKAMKDLLQPMSYWDERNIN